MLQKQKNRLDKTSHKNKSEAVEKITQSAVSLLILSSMLFTSIGGQLAIDNRNAVAETKAASYSDYFDTVASTSDDSVFSGIASLIASKGGTIITKMMPTVGDFLAKTAFDALGIDYTDSYTKKLNEVTTQLNSIQSDIKKVLENQNKSELRSCLNSFYNTANVISNKIFAIYNGFNTLMRLENEGSYTADKAAEQEKLFYELNLNNLIIGSNQVTGSLDMQIQELAEKIVDVGSLEASYSCDIVKVFTDVYSSHWAFDSQSIEPTKNFLSYVSTILLEAVTLYEFQASYEITTYTKAGNTAQVSVVQSYWSKVQTEAAAALDVLKTYYNKINATEALNKRTETVLHYATNTRFSTKLYTSQAFLDKKIDGRHPFNSNCAFLTYSNRYASSNNYSNVTTFDQTNILNTFTSEYTAYCTYFGKDSEKYTFNKYLQDAGFTSDSWDFRGFYRNWSYKHEGNALSTEFWRFYVNYTTEAGKSETATTFRIKQKVLGSTSWWFEDDFTATYAAFVKADGYLCGNYSVFCRVQGYDIPNDLGKIFNKAVYQTDEIKAGKVR
jgi:hypothetical protein